MNDTYQTEVVKNISEVRSKFPLQPIIFAGSGLTIRWANGPSWQGLLKWAVEECPEIDKPFNYFSQQYPGQLPKVASALVEPYYQWAWGEGKSKFSEKFFEVQAPKEIYLKSHICSFIKKLKTEPSSKYEAETKAFSAIRPHCVITTNYDNLVDTLLPGYQPVLGRGLITTPFANIGEIYKIHGTAEKPSSIILTEQDYENFSSRRKYLTAKLLTFFSEHPILFVGYSIEDENIRSILSDLDQAMDIPGEIVKNVFVLDRRQSDTPAKEKMIQVSASKGVRVNSIETDDFTWVFEAFGHNGPLENFNPQVLRAILARSYHLVRTDIPKQKIEVDFSIISEKTSSNTEFAKLFGLAELNPANNFSIIFPHNLTAVGKKLGYPGWHGAKKLIKRIAAEKGIDISSSDNRYHSTVRMSSKSKTDMYSEEAVDLLKKVKENQPYELKLT